MSALVIKNLPEPLHRQLKKRAERNHRSLTKEAIAVLEAAVRSPEADATRSRDALAALFAAGDALSAGGVNFKTWAAKSRNVWR